MPPACSVVYLLLLPDVQFTFTVSRPSKESRWTYKYVNHRLNALHSVLSEWVLYKINLYLYILFVSGLIT